MHGGYLLTKSAVMIFTWGDDWRQSSIPHLVSGRGGWLGFDNPRSALHKPV
jgi:hypothetical protein